MFKILSTNDVYWEDYKNLRLEALQKEPQAFGSSYEKEKLYSDDRWQENLNQCQKHDGQWIVFASDGTQLVGMLGAYQTEEAKKNNTAEIIAVYVKEAFRGKGIAKMLMNKLLDDLKQSHLVSARLAVSIEQNAALALYDRFGFLIIKEDNIMLGDGKYHDEYIMGKML